MPKTITLASADCLAAALPRLLGQGDVTAVVQTLEAAAADLARAWVRLTAEERARADRFRDTQDRSAFIAAHALMANMVDAALGPEPPAWRLAADQPGHKPRLHIDGGRQLHASLSHSRGMVLAAIGVMADLGVDVEAGGPVEDLAGIATLVMSVRERQALAEALHPVPLFYQLWTRKEAVLKAFGIGLSGTPTAIDVLDLTRLQLPSDLECPVSLVDLPVGGPAAAALCVLENAAEVHLLALG